MPSKRSKLVVATLLVRASVSVACTAIGVGKDASASGYPIVAHSEDAGSMANDVRLIRVPRKQWPAGSQRPLYEWSATYPRVVNPALSPEYAPASGEPETVPLTNIPQVAETWGYWDTDYGVQNEKGVSIGESTCSARTVGWSTAKTYGFNRAGIEDLSKLAMERCETARCAVETMGSIAVELGFYSADSGLPEAPAYSGSSECLLVGDAMPGEIWIFNVMTGRNNASAIWAAERVPSDHVVTIANAFSIRNLNLSDSENFVHSPNVTGLAEDMGWRNVKGESSTDIFDFFAAYGYTPAQGDRTAIAPDGMTSAQADANGQLYQFYSGRRIWRIFSLLSPSEGAKLDSQKGNLPLTTSPYPPSVAAPKRSVTLRMVMDTYRDHYEGTPYDLTHGMSAGPYGNPNRAATPHNLTGQWERAISMHRTSWSFILEARPAARSITWFGWDAPHGTAYLPFYAAAATGGPESYHSHDGHMSKYSQNVAWWAFNLLNQYQDLNFHAINKEVRSKSKEVEDLAMQSVLAWELEADKLHDPAAALRLLTERSNAFATQAVAEWWTFAGLIFSKYNHYVVMHNESEIGTDVLGQVLPEWWLSSPEVGFTSWSPDGPYHGKTLDSGALEAMANTGGVELSAAFLLGMLCTGLLSASMSATIAYKMGVRSGRKSLDNMDQGYYYKQT